MLSKTGELDVVGTAIAAMFITSLSNGLILNGASNLVLPGIQGAILIGSILVGVVSPPGHRPDDHLLEGRLMSTPASAVEAERASGGARPEPRDNRALGLLRDYGAILGMLGVVAVFGILEPDVLKPANLVNVLDQSASLAIMATGFAIAMVVRGVDLSVAQVADAAGLLAAYYLVHGGPLWAVFLVPLAFGLLVGVVNGTFMAYLGVPALIGTLGMMFVVRSFELVLSHGREAQILFYAPARRNGRVLLPRPGLGRRSAVLDHPRGDRGRARLPRHLADQPRPLLRRRSAATSGRRCPRRRPSTAWSSRPRSSSAA